MAGNLEPVSAIVFPGGFNWPIWVAQDNGYFADGGIEVMLTPTPNSVFQLTALIEGKCDIVHTAIDNVIAYMEGQGEAPVSVEPDIFAFMGGDHGFLALVTQAEIKSFADLKGKTLSVDAMTTGYAFVLFDLLKRNGINQDDVTFERAGGVLERWQALQQKQHAGTMLITPFDLMAAAAGMNVLSRAIDVYGPTRAWWARRGARGPRRMGASSKPTYAVTARALRSCTSPPTGTAALRPCARTCRRCRSRWRSGVTRRWWDRTGSSAPRRSTWRASPRSWRCAANTAGPRNG
jgi:hypothetical protein